ncbi:MAG: DUF3293 domain-containing protein [Acidimicrobiales bacterium]
MVWIVIGASAWLALVALTALWPRRSGVLAALAYPVGWVAGELPVQAILTEGALLGLLAWWGWPSDDLSGVVVTLAAVIGVANLILLAVSLGAHRVVSRQLASAPDRPLRIGRPRDDQAGRWWRTVVKVPWHPRWLEVRTDLAYGEDPRQVLDVWRRRTVMTGAPVVVYYHGGAWTFGHKSQQGRPLLHELAARGWVVVTPNYRLAPRHPWPTQARDAVAALAWVKSHIAAYGGDPDRVVVAGGSAGGQLAALVALAAKDPAWGAPAGADLSVRGCLSFYGVLEMTGDEELWGGLGRGLRQLLEHRVFGESVAAARERFEAASPLHRLHPGAPPFLVVQGRTDTLVEVHVARAFVARLRATSPSPAWYVELPGTQHAFDLTASPRTSAVVRAAVAAASAMAPPRPPLDEALLARYRVPPAQLWVEVDGQLVDARAHAARAGAFYALTSDNPRSQIAPEPENAAGRADLAATLARLGVAWVTTRSRDGAGAFPDEVGVGVASRPLALALARRYDQHALYGVHATAIEVIDADRGVVR